MERGSQTLKSIFWIFLVFLGTAEAKAQMAHPTLSVSAPHMYYICPEGANVTLVCVHKDGVVHPSDAVKLNWFFTPHSDQHCGKPGKHPRENGHSPGPGVHSDKDADKMWVTLLNVTHADQGRYCCVGLDIEKTNSHRLSLLQRSHSHVILQITPKRNGSLDCTAMDLKPPGGSVPVALALAACILALLSLPLILVLVYRQRQHSQSHRRAQELVRMDSEAQGHENPVFLGGSPHRKARTVSQIMTRQLSETGCHLLSDPGTPLSPPSHEDVFFPSEDTIPESPDIIQI